MTAVVLVGLQEVPDNVMMCVVIQDGSSGETGDPDIMTNTRNGADI